MSQAETGAGSERSPEDAGGALTGHPLTRRQALGRMSALATAGAAAWVAPQILTAKPAAGAALSSSPTTPGSPGSTGSTGSGPTGSGSTTSGATTSGSTSSPATNASLATNTSGSGSGGSNEPATLASADEVGSTLASTGANLERDAAIGAALVAGGWALHRWASRSPQVAGDAVEATAADPPQTA
jgi:hypothetical protein